MPKFSINLKRDDKGLKLGAFTMEMSPGNTAQVTMNESGDVNVEWEGDSATVKEVTDFLRDKFGWHGFDHLNGLQE